MPVCWGAACPGLLADRSSLPSFAISWDSIPSSTEQSASPSLLFSLQLLDTSIIWTAVPQFCVTVRFGFSPYPYSVFECVCCEFSSNISAPQGSRVMVMWGCARKAKSWQASSNIAELTVPRKFRLHPALHSCLSKKSEAKNSMLQVWCCLVTSGPAHQLGQVRVPALRQFR